MYGVNPINGSAFKWHKLLKSNPSLLLIVVLLVALLTPHSALAKPPMRSSGPAEILSTSSDSERKLDNQAVFSDIDIAAIAALSHLDLQAFRASYKLNYKWRELGYGEYTFTPSPDGISQAQSAEVANRLYRFALKTDLRLLLFSDQRQLYSDFYFRRDTIFPVYYRQDRQGTGKDYVDEVVFDQINGQANIQLRDQHYQVDFAKVDQSSQAKPSYTSVYDGLSVQFQLYLNIKRQQPDVITLPIIEKTGVVASRFILQGRQQLELSVNNEKRFFDCVVYQLDRDNEKYRTVMLFAKELGYFPLQLIHFTDGKKQFSAILENYQIIDAY